MTRERTRCRICGGTELASVLNLGSQALTGVFPKTRTEAVASGPLELVKCQTGCGLVQLRHSYDMNELYGTNYGYRSGLNSSMVRHLQSKVRRIMQAGVLGSGDLVVDIGSNDGTTLAAYPEGCFELVGIDPTGRKFAQFYPDHVRLIPDFFSADLLHKELPGRRAKVITSFSMFYDLEDPTAFMREIHACLDDEGLWVFEQSYLPAMLRTNSFDTVCHEHLEFYALKQICWMAERAGLKLLDVEFNRVNGGSFSVTAAKLSSKRSGNPALIQGVLSEENATGLDDPATWESFRRRVEGARRDLLQFLEEARRTGKRVCGLGASTKGNVLLQYFGIDSRLLEAIGEVNEDKFGAFTPGTLIPLVPENEVLASNPDFLLVLPWHFRDFFLQLPKLRGRALIFPLPHFELVEVQPASRGGA
jgi:C-methyltransferase-like protein/methyltransferase family protein/putative zinc binding protein